MRKVWMVLYNLFFRQFPESISGAGIGSRLRRFAVQQFIKECGKKPSIGVGARIHKNTIIGDFSGIGRNCELMNGVIIGNHVMMGPDCYICTENHEFSDTSVPMRMQGMRERESVTIEDDCWIGARVIILPGVVIGKGSVIGAGAVVAKSIPPFSVVVGNPARIVKTR